jgi:hypothetical protein
VDSATLRLIEQRRNERQAFATTAQHIAGWERADGDVQSVEKAAIAAEADATKLSAILALHA